MAGEGKLDFVNKKTDELYGYAEQFRNYLNDLLRTIGTIADYVRDPGASNQIRQLGNTIFEIAKDIPQKYVDYSIKLSYYVQDTKENLNVAFSQLDQLDREIDDCINNLLS